MPKKIREPADPSHGPVAAFGFDLRTLRQQADLTYAAIAESSYFSKSAVHAVDQGHQLPSATILKAFVAACGGDPQPWLERRTALLQQLAARRGDVPEKISLRARGLPAPDPATVGTTAEFNDGLKRLREWSGLTYRQITERTCETHRVAPSTLCGAITRGTLPNRTLVASFLQAIDLDEDAQQAWLAAWQAIKDGDPVPAAQTITEPTWLDAQPTEPGPVEPLPRRVLWAPIRIVLHAPMRPADPPASRAAAQYVIPMYLPPLAIRDWAFRDGQWRAVDGVPLPEPVPADPHAGTAVTGRRRRWATATALILALVIAVIVMAWM